MPKFDPRFQRLAQVKKYKEDQIKIELANLKREYIHQESILWTLEENLREQLAILSEKQKKLTYPLREILWSYNYITVLHEDIENQKKKLEELDKKINQVTTKLITASQEKRIMENLNKRRFIQFKLEIEKQEQEFMDEVGITRYGREQIKVM